MLKLLKFFITSLDATKKITTSSLVIDLDTKDPVASVLFPSLSSKNILIVEKNILSEIFLISLTWLALTNASVSVKLGDE